MYVSSQNSALARTWAHLSKWKFLPTYILYLQENDRPVDITASLFSTMLESMFDIILDAGLHY